MAKLLMVVSSTRTIRLADGSDHPTGYLAEEVLEPYEMFEAAGVDVVIASPEGKVPQPDPWGFEPFFHYPQVDEDFMFSILRRFAYHPDRVVDRNLITGQNPGSADAAAHAVLKRLTA